MSTASEEITPLAAASRAEEVREALEKSHDLHQVIIDALISHDKEGELSCVVRVLNNLSDELWEAAKLAKQTEELLYQQFRAIAGQGELKEVAA